MEVKKETSNRNRDPLLYFFLGLNRGQRGSENIK